MRHEKGIGPDLPRLAAARAAQLICEITGATLAQGMVDNDPGPHPARRIMVRVGSLERLLGIELTGPGIRELLGPLGFEVTVTEDELEVVVPSHRLDVSLPADVAEEVARAYGYERIPGRLPAAQLPPYRPDPSGPRHMVRRILAGLGLNEIVTHALVGPEDLVRAGQDGEAGELVRLFNPLSVDHSILRRSMVPSMLGALAENARQRQENAWLFDLGKVYWYRSGGEATTPRDRGADTAGTGRYEAWELGIILAGNPAPRSPGRPPEPAQIGTLKGIIDALHDSIGAPRPAYRAETDEERHPHRHPGRTGRICDAQGRAYGSLGEVHPRVAGTWGLPGRPVDASISVDRLLALVPEGRTVRSVPAAQPIDRDLAVILPESTPVGELLRIARMSAGLLLDEVHLFDVYRGSQVGEGRVSYALALRFQPAVAGDEKSVDKALNKVRGSLRHHLGAEIR